MATFPIDLSDIESRTILPKGKYAAVIQSLEIRKSQSSEHPYINWTLKTIPESPDEESVKMFYITSLSPKSLWRLAAVFSSFGINEQSIPLEYDEESGIVTYPNLVDETVIIDVTIEQYQGRPQNRIQDLVSATPVESGPIVSASAESTESDDEGEDPDSESRAEVLASGPTRVKAPVTKPAVAKPAVAPAKTAPRQPVQSSALKKGGLR